MTCALDYVISQEKGWHPTIFEGCVFVGEGYFGRDMGVLWSGRSFEMLGEGEWRT